MNITMNSAPSVTLPVSTEAAPAASPVPADGLARQPALANPLAFFQFLELDAVAPAPAPEVTAAVLDDAPTDAPPAVAPEQDPAAPDAAQNAAPDQLLLAAMAMPLMPSMMPAPAALPPGVRLAGAMPEQPRAVASASAAAAAPSEPALLAQARAAMPAAVEQLAPAKVPAQAAQPAAIPAPVVDAAAPVRAVAAHTAQAAPAAPAPAAAGQPAAPQSDAKGSDARAANDGVAPLAAAAPAPATAARENVATVTLSGPPTAWRQPLQQALGERLNLQLGKNAEQAVIRLEPPMLGRVEISIRHAAGSLEVHISATHGEVLRQLNTVSEQLRNDLAGRQFSDVSVNVTQAPRAQAAAQPGAGFNADAQGRGRQQDQQEQQNRQPGAALAEAHQPHAAFSLSGRT